MIQQHTEMADLPEITTKSKNISTNNKKHQQQNTTKHHLPKSIEKLQEKQLNATRKKTKTVVIQLYFGHTIIVYMMMIKMKKSVCQNW